MRRADEQERWEPHEGQRSFLEAEARIKVLACGRRWGKTDACAASIVRALELESPTRHVLLAPTLDQAKLLFDRVVEMLRSAATVGQGSGAIRPRSSPYPRLSYRGHRISARSGHLGRLLRGNEATHIVVDEAAFVPEDLITEVAMPMLATTNGQLTLISTPRGKNHFWRFFQMGKAGEHGVWSRHGPSWESPWVQPDFLAVQRQVVSERAFRVEYGAEFIDAAGMLFRAEAIDGCLCGVLPRPVGPPFSIGVDFGRHRDYTAVAVLSGHAGQAMLVEIQRIAHLSISEQLDLVARIVSRYPGASVLCDATALQDSFVEELQGKGLPARIGGFVFTGQSKGPLIEGLASLIDHRRLAMTPHPDLLRELEHFEAEDTGTGTTKYGASSGNHDDMVIALALAVAMLPGSARATVALGARRKFAADGRGET